MKAKTKTYKIEIKYFIFISLLKIQGNNFPNKVFDSFEKLLQLMSVRKSKNNFKKMSKKLTDFFISNKKNISLSKMQESVASI